MYGVSPPSSGISESILVALGGSPQSMRRPTVQQSSTHSSSPGSPYTGWTPSTMKSHQPCPPFPHLRSETTMSSPSWVKCLKTDSSEFETPHRSFLRILTNTGEFASTTAASVSPDGNTECNIRPDAPSNVTAALTNRPILLPRFTDMFTHVGVTILENGMSPLSIRVCCIWSPSFLLPSVHDVSAERKRHAPPTPCILPKCRPRVNGACAISLHVCAIRLFRTLPARFRGFRPPSSSRSRLPCG